MNLPFTILTKEGRLDGKLVKKFRERLSMSQEDLDEASGVSRAAISKIERERPKKRRLQTVKALQAVLEKKTTTNKFGKLLAHFLT